jgi:hypothetical protein
MRPDRILQRPLFHPRPDATLKSSVDARLYNLAVRHIPDRHSGTPRPIPLQAGSRIRQIHGRPLDFRVGP